MWDRNDHKKEITIKNTQVKCRLKCPMCKGRGYFDPNDETQEKSNEEMKLKDIKLPPLIAPSKEEEEKNKDNQMDLTINLPSIGNIQNLPETKPPIKIVRMLKDKKNNENKTKNRKNTRRKVNGSDEGTKGDTSPNKERVKSGDSTSSLTSDPDKELIPRPMTPDNPQETLRSALHKMKQSNWCECLNGIRDVVQISRYFPSLLQTSMILVYRVITSLIKSFRTTPARTACQAVKELFRTMANTQRPDFDELVGVLLHKTADMNRFLRQDANEALDAMVLYITPFHSVRVIVQKGTSHKNAMVRATAARLLVCLVGVTGVDNIFYGHKETRGRIIQAGAQFIDDGNQETRVYGRRLMKMLLQNEQFETVLQNEVNEAVLQRIDKVLVNLKYNQNEG